MHQVAPIRRSVSHQTVRHSARRYASPDEGACVMELASMLAGESFSDAPRSVCPVIAAFFRTYNDRMDDRRRQDVYAYAVRAVGTRSTNEGSASGPGCAVNGRGGSIEPGFATSRHSAQPPTSTLPPTLALLGFHRPARAGQRPALAAAHDPGDRLHRATLRFVDELIAVVASPAGEVPDRSPRPESARTRCGSWPLSERPSCALARTRPWPRLARPADAHRPPPRTPSPPTGAADRTHHAGTANRCDEQHPRSCGPPLRGCSSTRTRPTTLDAARHTDLAARHGHQTVAGRLGRLRGAALRPPVPRSDNGHRSRLSDPAQLRRRGPAL
jgi:hypothetical protein